MDFASKVSSTYDKEIKKYQPAIDAVKEAARGKEVIEQLPDKKRDAVEQINKNETEEFDR